MAEETALAGTTPDTSEATTETAATTEAVIDTTTAEGTTAEPKAEEAKGDEASKADVKPVVPEAYEFKVAEGMTLDDGAIALATPILKELNVTQEGAQKLADVFSQIQAQQVAKQSETWLNTAKADAEIGGKAFDENTKLAQAAFAKFAKPELKAFLDQTGLGNHPELLRMFVSIGKASAQDTHVPAGADGAPVDIARKLYTTMK